MSAGTDIPQIPWARNTKVLKANGIIRLKSGHTTIEVETGGQLIFSVDSKSLIEDHMERHEALTYEVREWFEKECEGRHRRYRECIKEWIEGKKEPQGVKEWRPGVKFQGKRWKIGSRGQANTYNEDHAYWWGHVFEYTHFEMPDKHEGLVIMWQLGGDPRGDYGYPEVWIGSVDEFLDLQYEPAAKDSGTIASYNQYFENGILWAYDQHGLFEYNDLPEWALDAIGADPWLLWPDLVDRLIPIAAELDKDIQSALRAWIERRRREAEKTTGQRFLWPEEQDYADQPEEDQPWATA